MTETTIAKLPEHIDSQVTLFGWAWHQRGSGKVRFIKVRDGSGFVQAVVGKEDVGETIFDVARHISQESSIKIVATVVTNDRDPLGVELLVSHIEVINESKDYPITPKEHGTDFLMDNRHLWLRSPRQHAILQVRHQIITSVRSYFDSDGFTLVDAPIFTPNACEGTSNLFETDYFGQSAYLSQSGQLYMEAAAMAVGKAYCFGPTFRAENSNTRRHLTEFWMVEPEVAYLELDGDMDLAEGLLQKIITDVLANCPIQLETLKRDTALLKKGLTPFARISYDEAVAILKSEGVDFTWGDDFGGGDETVISSKFETPVIVHRYPADIKPFYMKKDPENPKVCLNMDILAPEGYGEIVGGSEREASLDVLLEGIKKHDLDPEIFDWYLDLRKYGSVPHAGFGLGIERTVAWICGLSHVRETIPFPRLPRRIRP
ncbi:MAG: asparagine--tRNA ligase [Fibrobacterales bacterium]